MFERLNVTVQKYAPKWYAILKSAHDLELTHDVGPTHDVSLTYIYLFIQGFPK